ncbi:MAG: methyltransferase [Bacteroidales bacterium]|nr:methyltransferase [Bacteroidales bacterium]
MFQFKQFAINDDRCAMKVGTDGVLLGAWADVAHAKRVLDVGAGCGLISLMLAQRFPQIHVMALELDSDAAIQAQENAAESPFAMQVDVVEGDFAYFALQDDGRTFEAFDAIVSNPPFFEEDLLPPDGARANARHTAAGLNFENLVAGSARLLCDGGTLSVIIPKDAQLRFHAICNRHGFSLLRATDVRTVIRKAPKRVMLHFVKSRSATAEVLRDEIVLMQDGKRSAAYANLCHDFYL